MSPIPPSCTDCACSGGDLPPGGEPGQFLGKVSAVDGDVAWMYAPYTNYIFNSSGVQTGNRYNDWNDLYSALLAIEGPKHVYFEQDETLPPGAYDLSNVTLHGQSAPPGLTLTFPTGVTVTSWVNGGADHNLNLLSTSATYIMSNASGIFELQKSAVAATTAPFFFIPSGGFFVPAIRDGSFIANLGSPVIEVDPGAVFAGAALGGIASQIQDDIVSGSGTFARLIQSPSADLSVGNLQPSFLGVYLTQYFTSGKAIGYDNSIVGILSSNNVQDAIDELAGLV